MVAFGLPNLQQIFFVLVGFFLVKFLLKRFLSKRKLSGDVELQKKDWEKDVVYLYQFPRPPTVPNLSPFCLKVETWLRVHQIKYEVIEAYIKRSVEGLLPFVELNGEHIADSQLIINKLSKYFEKEDKFLSREQSALSRAVDRMIDGSTFYALLVFKIVEHTEEFLHPTSSGMPIPEFLVAFFAKFVRGMMKDRLTANGIYRHNREDILNIARRDVQAISDILGNKPYLFGDQPSVADCTLFAQFSTVYYLPFDQPINHWIYEEYTNIGEFMTRMKENVFPDWEKLITTNK